MGKVTGWRIARLLLIAQAFVASAIPSLAQNSGYSELWSGYAAITTCRSGQDAYQLGRYVFVCSGYDYPYHYGDVVLLATLHNVNGRSLIFGRLCLVGAETCLDGEVHAASSVSSPKELTRACRDARDELRQSAERLASSISGLQGCLRRDGFYEDCRSSADDIASRYDTYERIGREIRDSCE